MTLLLLLHETEAELRSNEITMISSECNVIYLASIPNTVRIGNYVITSYLVNKRVSDNYC